MLSSFAKASEDRESRCFYLSFGKSINSTSVIGDSIAASRCARLRSRMTTMYGSEDYRYPYLARF